MSSDKAPEKIYVIQAEGEAEFTTFCEAKIYEQMYPDKKYKQTAYIREDLINKDAGYEEYIRERTEYEEQQKKEAIAKIERRRELFEKVALAVLNENVGKTIEYEHEWISVVYRRTRQILEASDEFANKGKI